MAGNGRQYLEGAGDDASCVVPVITQPLAVIPTQVIEGAQVKLRRERVAIPLSKAGAGMTTTMMAPRGVRASCRRLHWRN